MSLPKEKAKELFDKYDNLLTYLLSREAVKQVVLSVIDEVIESLNEYDERTEKYLKEEFGLEYFNCELQNMDSDFRYWSKVRQEIEILFKEKYETNN